MRTTNSHETVDAAIIGAGPAGIAAARKLRQAGCTVRILEKGRGFGGRLSTRRSGSDLHFDHGCQFVSIPEDLQLKDLAEQCSEGTLQPWASNITADASELPFDDAPRLIGVPTMNSVLKELNEGPPPLFNTTITSLKHESGLWHLFDADELQHAQSHVVITAVTSSQAVPLLAPIDFKMMSTLLETSYDPLWSLLCSDPPPSACAFDAMAPADGPLSWIANQASKPQRSSKNALVAIASRQWSRDHIERDADWVAEALAEAIARTLKVDTIGPAVASRWKHAIASRTAGIPVAIDAEQNILACGDWCLGPTVGHAIASGYAAADAALNMVHALRETKLSGI